MCAIAQRVQRVQREHPSSLNTSSAAVNRGRMGCAASSEASDEELAMRKEVMKAARGNDMAAMRKAIKILEDNFNDPERTKSAFGMWDDEEKGYEEEFPEDPGPNPDGAGVRFMMPLKWAAWHGNAEMCKLIVERGAEVDSTCLFAPWSRGKFMANGGVPALSVAAMSGGPPGHEIDAVKYLVEAGANVHYQDFQGCTAADHAGKQGNSVVQAYLWTQMKEGKA